MSDADAIDVAFIGHPSSFSHIVSLIEEADGPEAARRVARNEKTFTAFLDWMPSNATRHRPVIQLNGVTVRAALIICWFLPQIIESRHKLKIAVEKVLEAVDIAAGMNAQVASLGGFTSILAGRRRFDAADAAGITLTAGNALTAALAVAWLRAELDVRGAAASGGNRRHHRGFGRCRRDCGGPSRQRTGSAASRGAESGAPRTRAADARPSQCGLRFDL